MCFDDITYLKTGNPRQQLAYQTLTSNQVFLKIKQFDPVLVGTIPIEIDIECSDLDIICCFKDKRDFVKTITEQFKNEKNFVITDPLGSNDFVLASFFIEGFEIEIFGQQTPTKQQYAYRHMIIEHHLLNLHGEDFRQQIIELKRQGYKTEPAFAKVLGLTEDPYLGLLKFEELL